MPTKTSREPPNTAPTYGEGSKGLADATTTRDGLLSRIAEMESQQAAVGLNSLMRTALRGQLSQAQSQLKDAELNVRHQEQGGSISLLDARNNPTEAAAQIERNTRKDYNETYRPIEDELITRTNLGADQSTLNADGTYDRNGTQSRTDLAAGQVGFQADNAAAQRSRMFRRQGVALNSDQRESIGRLDGLSRGKNTAGAKNAVRRSVTDSNRSTRAGLIDTGRATMGTGAQGMATASGLQQARQNSVLGAPSQGDSAMSGAATGASIGFMAGGGPVGAVVGGVIGGVAGWIS